MVKIPHDTYVLVGDGRSALVLRNAGDEAFPNLQTVSSFQNPDNRKTSEIGSDKPGRGFESATHRRNSVEQTDWHDLGEHRFARHVAEFFDAQAAQKHPPALILVAPPRTLAELRGVLSKAARERVILELNKDLTKFPVHDIETHLANAR